MSSPLRVLVIGGVACGPKTASRLKRLMPDADVTMIERDSLVSYGACGLPYYLEGEFININALTHTQVGLPRTPEFFEKTKGFKTLTRTEALSIDRKNKSVHLKNLDTGIESDMPYDKLVLATGGYAFRPPISGVNLKNVWFMTHPEHARTLVEEIKEQGFKKAVMVGAGFIGIEVTEALINKGLNVTLVEMFDQIMPGVLDKDIAAYAQLHMEDNEVDLALGERVVAINPDKTGEKAASVQTDKQTIEADCVIIAVGTRPNDKLAREAGIPCMEKGGILINEFCQTGDPDIYAGGDCVVNRYISNIFGSPMYAPLGSTANKHGRIIADHIAGRSIPFDGVNGTGIVKCFDFNIGRTGITEKMAKQLNIDYEVITWGGPDRPHYMKNARYMLIKMLASKRDRKLLGVQAAGMGDTAKRVDVAATTIYFGGTLDQLANLDLAYAPPYGPPIDPIAVCAQILSNKMDGIAKSISAEQAKKLMETSDAVMVDVREPDENKMLTIECDEGRHFHIPLGQLRERMNELPKDRDILTYCKISLRGYEAQLILNAAGFERVKFIEGGHEAWPYGLNYLGM